MKRAKQQSPLVSRINAQIQVFGWRMNVNGADGLQMQSAEAGQLELDAEKLEDCAGRMGMRIPRSMTACFWRALLISPAVLHSFRKLADARALAEFFCPSTRQISMFRGLASNSPSDAEVLAVVQDVMCGRGSRVTTQAGMVRHGQWNRISAIWFGSANLLPAFLGDEQILTAVRTLFRIQGGSVDLGENIW